MKTLLHVLGITNALSQHGIACALAGILTVAIIASYIWVVKTHNETMRQYIKDNPMIYNQYSEFYTKDKMFTTISDKRSKVKARNNVRNKRYAIR